MNAGHKSLSVAGGLARLLGAILRRWELALAIVFFLSPVGPHLRLVYSSWGNHSDPLRYFDCLYIGSRGLITPDLGYLDGCPVVAWIDTREAAE